MIDSQGNYVPDVTPVTTANTPTTSVTAPVTASSIPVPTPTEIYSSSNIAQATNAPVAPPDLSNASSIYDYYLNGADVTSARTAAEADAKALAAAKATARNRQLAIEGNPLESQQFIVGQQARAGQLDTATLNALADAAGVSSAAYASAKQTASEKANVALSQRSELVQLITQNPGAKIKFTDTIESATKKISDYQDEQAKKAKKAADEEYKKNLKETLMQLGISNKTSKGGTMSVKSMEKALTASYKSKADADKALKNLQLQSAQLDLKEKSGSSLSKLETLLTEAAKMPEQGREWALANASKYGVSTADVQGVVVHNNWEDSYRKSTDNNKATAVKQIGDWVYYSDGTRENQVTGEVQQQQ